MGRNFTRAACCFAVAACAITARAEDEVVVEDDNGCKMYIGKYAAEGRWKYNTGVSWSGACNGDGFIHGPGVLEISSGDSRSALQTVQDGGKDIPSANWVRYSYDVHYRKLHTRAKGGESVELSSAEGVPAWAHFIFTGEFTRPEPAAPVAKKLPYESCAKTVELKPDGETSLTVDLGAYMKGKGGAMPARLELEEKLLEYRARASSAETAALIASTEQLSKAIQPCYAGWYEFDAGNGCKIRYRYRAEEGVTHLWKGGCVNGFAEGPGRWETMAGGEVKTAADGTMLKGVMHGPAKETQEGGVEIEAEYEYGTRTRGRIKFSNGTTYEGALRGEPLVGTLKYSNGLSYSGEVVKMQPHGRGRMFFTDGAIGTGTFKEGKRHGRVFMQGKNWGKLGYRVAYEDGKVVQQEQIYEGGLKKDIFADIANVLNIANSALQGLGPAAASGRLRPEQTMALVAAQTAATMATQERPAIPVATSTPAASAAQAGPAAGGVLGPQDLEAALAQMAESKRRADEKRRAEEEQAKREADRQRLALAQEERRQAAEQKRRLGKQEKQKQAASTRRIETYETTRTINIPAHSGCVRPNWKKGPHLWTLELQNTCAFPVQVAWCTGSGCRPGQALTRIPSGGVDRNPGHGNREDVNWRACQLKSGEFDVVYYSAVDQCQTKIRVTEQSEVTPGQR